MEGEEGGEGEGDERQRDWLVFHDVKIIIDVDDVSLLQLNTFVQLYSEFFNELYAFAHYFQ